jgi:helix-turn-helix protein
MVDKPWEEGAIKVIRKAQVLLFLFISQKTVVFLLLSKLAAPFALQNYLQRF